MTKQKLPVLAVGILLIASSITMISGCEKKESAQPTESATPSMPAPESSIAQPSSMPEAAATMTASGVGETSAMSDAEAAMKKSDCFTCHAVDKKLIGPAYEWVAFRYKDDKDAIAKLTKSVKEGSSGKWTAYTNGVPMTPHPQLTDAEIKTMLEWVLSQKPVEPPKS